MFILNICIDIITGQWQFHELHILFYWINGVTYVNKTTQVSSVQLSNTSAAHRIVCSLPEVNSPSATIHLPFGLFHLLPPAFPSGNHFTVVCICFSPLNPFTFFTQPPTPFPPDYCQSVLCISESVSILFVGLFCFLDSTYKWNHVVFIFLWPAYFT